MNYAEKKHQWHEPQWQAFLRDGKLAAAALGADFSAAVVRMQTRAKLYGITAATVVAKERLAGSEPSAVVADAHGSSN